LLPNLLDDLMRAWDHKPSSPEPQSTDAPAAEPEMLAKFVAVALGRRRFAFPVESVVEAARCPRTTRVPGLPEYVRGVFSFRGEVLPLIDMQTLLAEIEPRTVSALESRILTLQASQNGTRAAFSFDSLEGIVNLRMEQPRKRDTEHPVLGPAISAIGKRDGDAADYTILEAAALLRAAGCLEDNPEVAA
jgi:chemotaxis signal transduction protein